MQARTETADQRIEYAGLDHRGSQVDRSARLRIAFREIEFGDAIPDVDRDGELHRLVDGDAVIVEKALGRGRRLRQFRDGAAQLFRRAAQDGREGARHGFGAEARAKLADARRAHFRDRDLRRHVAAHQRRLARIGQNETLDVGQLAPGVPDLEGRHEHALVKHFRRVGGCRSRHGAADVGLVRDGAREGDDFAIGENRRDKGHVGNVRQAALVGVVADVDVAIPDLAAGAVKFEHAADEMAIHGRVEEHGRRDDEPALAVENDAGKVAGLADDRRIAGAIEMIVHFIDKAGDLVAQDLDGDRVHDQAAPFSSRRLR